MLKIARIGLNVADLERACAFYTDALGFSRRSASAKSATLALGRQEIELRASAGRPYPEPRLANDPWFQHFAIAVSDMDAAYRRLSRYAQKPISRGGPQLLPPSTGSVTAYKFRDPDGHPLELSYIPGSAWLAQAGDAAGDPCLGIDHSALAVRDLAASAAFYTDMLGLSLGGRGLNRGAEQDRLDGLDDVQLDIVTLNTAEPGPHIELLRYRSPQPSAAAHPLAPDDIAATRLILRAADLAAVEARLGVAGLPATLLQDPDGHWLEVFQSE